MYAKILTCHCTRKLVLIIKGETLIFDDISRLIMTFLIIKNAIIAKLLQFNNCSNEDAKGDLS
ncbi:hypothetical protein T05_14721 [Trichinella murrelli]|uniref:Uncharacterized protein n=1 Tax=Trichinella murrelli TaxID=144512 RepID=A0A0V0T456_9BILA|nr:hypothetical protein T05_14721 [Trichinella murrelli]